MRILIVLCVLLSGCSYTAENRVIVNGKNVVVEFLKFPPTIKGEDIEVDISRDSWWKILYWRSGNEKTNATTL